MLELVTTLLLLACSIALIVSARQLNHLREQYVYVIKENINMLAALMLINNMGHEVNDKEGHIKKCRACIAQKALTEKIRMNDEHIKDKVVPIKYGQE